MKQHNIIMYTMTTCGYCKQMKDYLDKEKIKYEERNYKDFKEEWNTIKSLTHSAIFPTFVVGEYQDEILITQKNVLPTYNNM